MLESTHIPPIVNISKRMSDVVLSALALLASLPLLPLIALAIRLDSPGPLIFRQLRVGRALHDRTELFVMYKFRSMRVDAERCTGAVWATKRDPRATRVGAFLRKARLDEIPQLWNVLRGDMTLVGPRPERPGFYQKLEAEIPYFAERTTGLRPGITGLAQVRQGYDTCLDDVRRKVACDHAYSLRLSDFSSWIVTDLRALCRTATVVFAGRGQ